MYDWTWTLESTGPGRVSLNSGRVGYAGVDHFEVWDELFLIELCDDSGHIAEIPMAKIIELLSAAGYDVKKRRS